MIYEQPWFIIEEEEGKKKKKKCHLKWFGHVFIFMRDFCSWFCVESLENGSGNYRTFFSDFFLNHHTCKEIIFQAIGYSALAVAKGTEWTKNISTFAW